ncbi:M56 family metallopeptidase [Snuella sedimenti]|uniref:Energy transducer TonB n=1 Tax=Snuella sedimenti TaxID=2798802 RepID=A0A8J7IH87_9FLAO|nr:M56 family metallopeptidase [Snuella sedimenti]MBJ6367756.1 energy transducer TonB [Snuella sedimenti]
MLHYILQTIVFQLFFLLVYDVFLNKETFFNWNRIYLLGTAVLSILLPFIKIKYLKETLPTEYIEALPVVILGQESTEVNVPIALDAVTIVPTMPFWEIILYIGIVIALAFFLFKLSRILFFVFKNPKQRISKAFIVSLLNSSAAFSFFHYIFLGEHIREADKQTIVKHELVHVTQRHTIDLMFFEMLRVFFWFNPLVYMYQIRMATLHEYIADAHAVKYQDKNQYYQNLLSEVFDTKHISFINTFFNQSLIKKRIVMLSKSRSKQINLIKYVLLIPVVFGMLVYTSAEAQKEGYNITTQQIDDDGQYQELDDEELKEKLYSNILEMEKAGMTFTEILIAYKPKSDLYIISRVDYYKSQMADKYMLDKGETPVKDLSKQQKMTYADYLAYKKTDAAKLLWESDIKDGILRLVVSDRKKLTDAEKARKKSKIELLKKDDNFRGLLTTDGKLSTVFYKKGNSKENKNEESELIMLNEVEVPFALVDQAPVFPGCEALASNTEKRNCMSGKIQEYLARNFNADIANTLGLTGRQRINVIFKIDTKGDVIGIRSRAPHPDLEAEAIRVIKSLPKITPGKQRGQNVIVPYTLPIIFQVQDKSVVDETVIVAYGENNKVDASTDKRHENNTDQDIEVPFAVIDQVPVFPGCEGLTANEEKKRCMSDKISGFVNHKFNTDIATVLGLTGRQRINVIFKIDAEGNITGIRSRAPHPELEKEAVRVISLLPKMTPGQHNGKNVTVPYSLPIVFEVDNTQLLDETAIVGYADDSVNNSIPFAVVNKAPTFPECASLDNESEQKDCTITQIQEHVNRNFNTDLAKSLGLKGKLRINVVFRITKEGAIAIERSRAPHPELEAEAIRVIKSMPKLIPGEHEGEKVDVLYSLPIIFQVQK